MSRLSGWLLTDDGHAVAGAEGLVESLEFWFAGSSGAAWRGDDENGLPAMLDSVPGWWGWDSWDHSQKAENLRMLLDSARDRTALIPPGDELAHRLTGVWQGEWWRGADEYGLACALDQLPGWESWAVPDLTLETLRAWLTPLPSEWDAEAGAEHARQVDGAAPDGHQPELDESVNPPRWRRKAADAEEFEHYHQDDDVWERHRDGLWHRLHSDAFGWMAYDRPSGTWLDPATGHTRWRTFEEVGTPLAASPEDPVARLAEERNAALSEALVEIRQSGVSPATVTDEQITELLDQYVLEGIHAN
jgi:hypothetical protein